MRVRSEADSGRFLERAGPFLARRPVECNVVATVAAAVRDGQAVYEDPLWFLVEGDGGGVLGVAMHTPPSLLAVAPMPPAAPGALAGHLAGSGRRVAGVSGTEAEARAFATAWVRLRGVTAREGRRLRLYRLDRVEAPVGVVRTPGRARPAEERDHDLLVAWTLAFAAEAAAPVHDTVGVVRRAVRAGLAYLWTRDGADGEPVSYAVIRPPAAGVARLGPVYTPPEHRRRGYAGALTAEVSRRALDAGARLCMLYTDLANPTSNAIYQAVGYRPVTDALEVHFDPPDGPEPGDRGSDRHGPACGTLRHGR